MFFEKRRLALRVVETLELPVKGSAATELVSMIVEGAKQLDSFGSKFSNTDLVLLSASVLHRNPSAIQRLSENSALTPSDAVKLLRQLTINLLALGYSWNPNPVVTASIISETAMIYPKGKS